MKINNIRNRDQFIRFMNPYGNHIEFIIGDYYSIQKVNMSWDLYEIKRYDEEFNKVKTKRLICNGCEPIEIIRTNAEECVNLIVLEFRKEKILKIKERICSNQMIN